jgi:hypothetical protein
MLLLAPDNAFSGLTKAKSTPKSLIIYTEEGLEQREGYAHKKNMDVLS